LACGKNSRDWAKGFGPLRSTLLAACFLLSSLFVDAWRAQQQDVAVLADKLADETNRTVYEGVFSLGWHLCESWSSRMTKNSPPSLSMD
jgi:hypothetical protein